MLNLQSVGQRPFSSSHASLNKSQDINFGRALKQEEKSEYKETIHEALDVLGVQNLALIMHGTCFPSQGRDIGVGSPVAESSKDMIDFLDMNGFNSVQLGPGGKISRDKISPYLSNVFSKNPLFIDLKQLTPMANKQTQKKYGNILSSETFVAVSKKSDFYNDKSIHWADFPAAFEANDVALREAFTNFKEKVKTGDPFVKELNSEFIQYKKENDKFLNSDSLFEALALVNKTRDYNRWFDLDKNLVKYTRDKNSPKHSLAIKRKNNIEKTMKNDIEYYKFKQFLVSKQEKQNVDYRKNKDFKYIGDALVGFGPRDVWSHPECFAKGGWCIGAPGGGTHNGKNPQTWAIPLLEPKKMFNDDGSLGPSGQLLKDKFDFLLDNYDNVRVDHVLGVVDPWVYKPSSIHKHSNGLVDRGQLESGHLSNIKGLDPKGDYRKALEKIIVPSMKEHGLDPKDAVWEDLGSSTKVFKEEYSDKLKLPGITMTLWMKGEHAGPNNWSMIGCHDHNAMTKLSWNKESDPAWKPEYLAGYLMDDSKYLHEKHPDLGYSKNEYQGELGDNFKKGKAKFVELFRSSKNVQLNFMDLFGIDETYNIPGDKNPTNWRLRVNNNYEDVYYKNLEKDDYNNIIINMPETLKKAVIAKDMKAVHNADSENKDNLRDDLQNKHKNLISKLAKFEAVLKEPSV